ncbi:MAG: glyoxylate/hydroxypyruvate reductase A [Proteobacteria bacterium]|nr:glyoxylate/hydroxypyruvate reductase A [Pseudomonadota bacterium]
MTARQKTLLLAVPINWASLWTTPIAQAAPHLKLAVHGRDAYDPGEIDYVVSFRPPPGLLKGFPKLQAVFSLGAGVDGFMADPDFPKHVPLVRFVHRSLSREMAQYIVLHVLTFHRQQRYFETAQAERKWRQTIPPRKTEDTRVGVLGLGEIGTMAAERLRDLDFPMLGWSRTRKDVKGVRSFAGLGELETFLSQSDILVCVLPLTSDTRHILNAKTFKMLPAGTYVINVARGGHLKEDDLIAAIDSGHLAGAALDVFETEPLPETSPLWAHPKISITPHIAALSDPQAMAQVAIDGIERLESGRPLVNVVDLARGY